LLEPGKGGLRSPGERGSLGVVFNNSRKKKRSEKKKKRSFGQEKGPLREAATAISKRGGRVTRKKAKKKGLDWED